MQAQTRSVLVVVLTSSQLLKARTRLVLIIVLLFTHWLLRLGVHLFVCVWCVGLRCWVVFVFGVFVGVLRVPVFLLLLLLMPRVCILAKSPVLWQQTVSPFRALARLA